MIFYSFYTDKFRDPSSLVYRTEDGWSPFQVNLKMFPQKEGSDGAQLDFFNILSDNPDFRQGEYFDTEKKKKKHTDIKLSSEVYQIPKDFKLELDKAYNLDCITFMKEVPNKYFDYIFTSPPYNIRKQIGSDNIYRVYGDNMTPEEYFNWLSEIIDEGLRVIKMHFFMNIQMLGNNKEVVLGIFGKYKKVIKDRMMWQKTIVAPHIQPGVLNSGFEDIIIFSNDSPHLKKFSDANWKQGTMSNVVKGINASRNQYAHLNKATFPTYLPRIFMMNWGKKGDIWYDPFNGTGTLAEAAAMEDMHWVGTELDNQQIDVTDDRFENELNKLKFEFPEENKNL